MFGNNSEPMVQEKNQVYTTKDYFLFKSIDGNRSINPLHLKRLKESMKEKYLFTVIIVNEKMEVIDGQHRIDCIIDLGLEVNYIICEGYGLNEVQILNKNSKDWSVQDYVNGYSKLGLEEYSKYSEFKTMYNFQHSVLLPLLTGETAAGIFKDFKDGKFRIANYKKSCYTAEKLITLKDYYDGYRRRSFVYAMLRLFKKSEFDFELFLHKLRVQPTKLQDCINAATYLELIESIYNFKNKKKVNLRF